MSPTLTAFWSAAGATVADFVIETDGSPVTVSTVAVDGLDGALTFPWSSVAVAVAVSVTAPLSTSVCVTVYGAFAVHVSDCPGARPGAGGVGQLTIRGRI